MMIQINKYVYSMYGIGFDMRTEYSLPYGTIGKNVIFGVIMSPSAWSFGMNILIIKKKIS